jgi:hypothetical protein
MYIFLYIFVYISPYIYNPYIYVYNPYTGHTAEFKQNTSSFIPWEKHY